MYLKIVARHLTNTSRMKSSFRLIESCVKQMMTSAKKQFTIAVEGNIGSGKSTVLAHLSKSSICDIVAEPIENWTNLRGNNILAMLYQDPHRWGFAFQANAQMSIAKLHAQPSKAAIKVMERSIFSARYCFVENLYRNQILQNVEYEILHDWFEMLTSNDSCHLDLIIYLRAKPETCLERIRTRNRPEEQSITLDYLNQLHERHEEWLSSRNRTPILIVDANQTKEHVYTDTNTHLINLVAC
jgi:thymidine kinase